MPLWCNLLGWDFCPKYSKSLWGRGEVIPVSPFLSRRKQLVFPSPNISWTLDRGAWSSVLHALCHSLALFPCSAKHRTVVLLWKVNQHPHPQLEPSNFSQMRMRRPKWWNCRVPLSQEQPFLLKSFPAGTAKLQLPGPVLQSRCAADGSIWWLAHKLGQQVYLGSMANSSSLIEEATQSVLLQSW